MAAFALSGAYASRMKRGTRVASVFRHAGHARGLRGGGARGAGSELALKALEASKLLLCVRLEDKGLAAEALTAVRAAVRGGMRAVEITMTTPGALDMIRQLAEDGTVHVGAGTVLSSEQAIECSEAGASFLMSPVTDPEVIRACGERDILMIPGAMTPTEIHTAYHVAGAKAVKIFPSNACGSVDFVKAMRGPFPRIPLLPTSGVKLEFIPRYMQCSNVLAVGISTQVLSQSALESRDLRQIERDARTWMAAATGVEDDR